MRFLIACFFLVLPQIAAAACIGSDLRAGLSPAQTAELDAAEARTPFAHGNRWRATRGDRVIHLIGTIHIPDARLDSVAERLEPLIAGVDRLFVEVTAQDKKTLEKNLASDTSLLLLQEATLPELMAEDDWQALAEAARDRGIPPFMASRMQPWYLSLVLAMPGCAMEMLGEGAGLDARVEEMAQAAGVPRQSIEPFDTVFKVFNAEPLDEQLRMLQMGVLPDAVAADMLVTTVNMYFDEANAANWHLSRLLTTANLDLPEAEVRALLDDMEAKLLTGRNHAWMEVIGAAPEEEIAVAVGAAHLMGADGLLSLLQAQGYTLERLAF